MRGCSAWLLHRPDALGTGYSCLWSRVVHSKTDCFVPHPPTCFCSVECPNSPNSTFCPASPFCVLADTGRLRSGRSAVGPKLGSEVAAFQAARTSRTRRDLDIKDIYRENYVLNVKHSFVRKYFSLFFLPSEALQTPKLAWRNGSKFRVDQSLDRWVWVLNDRNKKCLAVIFSKWWLF